MKRTLLIASLTALALLLPGAVGAQGLTFQDQAEDTLKRAKAEYNAERYEEAASLFLLTAQIDPGAAQSKGTPYRDLARCLFWIGNYKKATFWYEIYLRHWPDADDHDQVQGERDAANERRSDPGKRLRPSDIYDQSLLSLVDALRKRIDKGDVAYNRDGGGTAPLYFRAIKQGYAMPELARLSRRLRQKLLTEMSIRWVPSPQTPMPLLTGDTEPAEISRQRLKTLRGLAPSQKERETLDQYQRVLDAWKAFEAENHERAAGDMLDAAKTAPKFAYLRYVAALSQLRAGAYEDAAATLATSEPKASDAARPYYKILRAEALRQKGEHSKAANLLWDVIDQEFSKP